MGYEGFSKPLPLQRMHPIYGNRGEFVFLALFIGTATFIYRGRKKNEDALRKQIKTTNRYAELPMDATSKKPLKWTL